MEFAMSAMPITVAASVFYGFSMSDPRNALLARMVNGAIIGGMVTGAVEFTINLDTHDQKMPYILAGAGYGALGTTIGGMVKAGQM